MRWSVVAASATAVLALGLAAPARAAAQVRGLPVYNSGVPRGLAIHADVAFPNDEAGDGTTYAATARAGFGVLGVTAILSALDGPGDAGTDVSVGGTLNYRVFGGPLLPLAVTLQGGIGYAKPDAGLLPGDDVSELRFPVGLGLALTIPNPALAIRPWLAPRLDVVRVEADGDSDTETNFGLSGGIELNTLGGFGIQAAYDVVFADGSQPGIFGIGAHYAFRIPGL